MSTWWHSQKKRRWSSKKFYYRFEILNTTHQRILNIWLFFPVKSGLSVWSEHVFSITYAEYLNKDSRLNFFGMSQKVLLGVINIRLSKGTEKLPTFKQMNAENILQVSNSAHIILRSEAQTSNCWIKTKMKNIFFECRDFRRTRYVVAKT